MATKKAAKKAPAKKKSAAKATKKSVKKAPAKRVVKKAVKKTTKKTTKKAAKKFAKKSAATRIVVPPVPVGSARSRTIDAKPVASAQVAAAPAPAVSESKKSGGSNRVVVAVVIGLLALGAIVLANTSSTSTTTSSSNTETAMPTESAAPSASASPTKSESMSATGMTAAPLGIVAQYTATGATIFWNATTAADGLKGYSVEFRSNGGMWNEVAMVGTDVTKYDITKTDTAGWTSFKISAVYNDGQKAEGKVFGLPGQYK